MPDGNGTIFRVERTKDFTVMSNHHLKNTELSLKAKGLLSLILSLPDNWDYSTSGLIAICRDGECSVRSAIKELEGSGYIRREQCRLAGGQMGRINFIVSETPTLKNCLDTSFPPYGENPHAVNPHAEKPQAGNPAQLNTNQSSTQESNTQQSVIPDAEGLTATENRIKQQLDYLVLLERYDKPLVDELVELVLEVYLHRDEYLNIGREKKPTSLVVRRFQMLTADSIESVIDGLTDNTTRIKDMKAYLLKCLYNAPSVQHNKINAQVRHDMAAPTKVDSDSSYDIDELERMIRETPII